VDGVEAGEEEELEKRKRKRKKSCRPRECFSDWELHKRRRDGRSGEETWKD
jgi:hypothetical protein